jgi:hypothetical protein
MIFAMGQSPLDSTDEAFFAAVGRLTLAWGVIDSALEVMVLIIHTGFEGRKIEREAPMSLSRKIIYLKKCFSRIAELRPVKEILIPLFEEVREGSEMRHNIIHGFLLSIPDGTVTKMARMLRGARQPNKRFSISTAEILKSAAAMRDLAGRLTNVTIALGELPKPNKAN